MADLQRKARWAKLSGEVAEEIAANPRTNANARIGAARLLAELAGKIGAGRDRDAPADKPLSSETLRTVLDRIEGELARRARPVEATDVDPDLHLFE